MSVLRQAYYTDILQGSKPYTREQERSLFQRYRACTDEDSTEKARIENLLVRANLRFVYRVCLRYVQPPADRFDDIFTAGLDGLLYAIRTFKLESGNKLFSYAVWWVRQRVVVALKQEQTVHLPSNFWLSLKRLRQKQAECAASGTEMSDKQKEQLAFLEQASSSFGNISEFASAGGDDSEDKQALQVPDAASVSAFNAIDFALSEAADLNRLLQGVDPVDISILSWYYGLNETVPMTLADISDTVQKMYGCSMSRERVRQRLVGARARLRLNARKQGLLRDYVQ